MAIDIKQFVKFGFVAASVIGMAGCMGPKVKPSGTQTVVLEKAEVMPTPAQLKNEKPKMVIFPLRTSDRMANEFNLGLVAADAMHKYASSSSVDVIDRSLLKEMQAEIEKVEFEGLRQDSINNAVADYAMVGSLSSVSVGSSFTQRRTWTDKDGKTYVTAPFCSYTGNVAGVYKLVSLRDGRVAKSFELKDSVTTTTETNDSRCYISRGTQENLAKAAMVDAVEDTEYALKNFFAPRGYVIDAEQSPDGRQFFVQINIGTNQNVKAGDDVKFYTTRTTTNQLTGKSLQEEIEIGKGKVMSNLTQGESWVSVSNDLRAQMRIGAVAKIDHESFFGALSTKFKLPF
jgi:hypothetical protein